MIILETAFTDLEKQILCEYAVKIGGEIKIFYSITEKSIFYESTIEGNRQLCKFESPNRMIEIGGLYLLEDKGSIGVWNMGDFNRERGYVFWGEYGALDAAIRAL
jgi:hypothetical protein